MATKVLMPEMGEGVDEATIIRWVKQEGETINKFDALVEVNTDKVDSEIPAPISGTILKIVGLPDQEVAVDSILCWIGEPGEEIPADGGGDIIKTAEKSAPPASSKPVAVTPRVVAAPPAIVGSTLSGVISPLAAKIAKQNKVDLSLLRGTGIGGQITKADVLRGPQTSAAATNNGTPAPAIKRNTFISPVVARLSGEHGIDLSKVMGTGKDNRITKNDIKRVLENGGVDPKFTPSSAVQTPIRPKVDTGGWVPGTIVKHTPVRRSIAKHMVESLKTSAHVTTVMEADLSKVWAHRAKNKAQFAQDGANLTFTIYFMAGIVRALKAYPMVNSSWSDDGLILHQDINLGLAVSLDSDGLIVPVIKNADGLSLLGLAKSVNDLANRARGKTLTPSDVRGGTFTLTNHGSSKSLFATPIINQPQCGILGTGIIQKRAVVIDDAIAIRPMVYIGLTFDHRILDGAIADHFLGHIVTTLENWQD
jgi:pyruvate/2-oxoglutarate dehydrogenase complex dihydrolipoamide acyltransferase (E2) component